MMHHQMYKALADQHTQEVVAAARRHERIGAVRHDSTDATPNRHPKDLGAALMDLLHIRRGASTRSTRTAPASSRGAGSAMTSPSGAGPMGCSA